MMKKLIATACMVLCSAGAFAQLQGQNSESTSFAGSASTNAGNAQSITFTSPPDTSVTYSGTQTLRNVPSVSGPALITSNDTCMGSTSGSINGAGFGIGLGTTWTDDNCVMLKNSRELWNMGMKAASMALMCTDIRTRGALEVTGFVCPNFIDGRPRPNVATAPAAAKVATSDQPTDPYIRARLGLPPLTSAK
jgi:hypothetical protein